MREYFKLQQDRAIEFQFVPATNTKPNRIRIQESKRYSGHKVNIVYISFDYDIDNVQQQVYELLLENDYIIKSRLSLKDKFVYIVDWCLTDAGYSDLSNLKNI